MTTVDLLLLDCYFELEAIAAVHGAKDYGLFWRCTSINCNLMTRTATKKEDAQLELRGLSFWCERCNDEVDYAVLRYHDLDFCEACFVKWSKEEYDSGRSTEVKIGA